MSREVDALAKATAMLVAEQRDALMKATVDFVAGLAESDLAIPVKVAWFGGKPDAVPLHYLLSMTVIHGTHHRGQISQILDEMGIDHNFSGLDVGFLPK